MNNALVFFVVAVIALSWVSPSFADRLDRVPAGCGVYLTDPLPNPVAAPELDGIDQLLVLSDQWVIVASDSSKEVFTELDRLSDGQYFFHRDRWDVGREKGQWRWEDKVAAIDIYDEFITQARSTVELPLGSTEHFTISPDVKPSLVDRLLVSIGKLRSTPQVFYIDYDTYSYVKFPTPMVEGEAYTITKATGESVSFTFDTHSLVSRAIKVNQLGYMPEDKKKIAYLGAYLYKFGPLDFSGYDTFEVVNVATGEVTLTGPVVLVAENPRFAPTRDNPNPDTRPFMYGEDVYSMDFSELEEEGTFYIRVPGVGRSWSFEHSPDIYGEGFYTSARGMYLHRGGIEIEGQYTPWTRRKAIRAPYCESDHISTPLGGSRPSGYSRFDVIGGSMDCSVEREEVAGGWHDAADWDSNNRHYSVVFDLLSAYSLRPTVFTDNQLNIPESGNGVPDILDEARFGLELWRHSMNADGGVSGVLETSQHTNIDGKVGSEQYRYAFSQRTRWDSLIFAAAAAQYSQLVRPFNAEDADLYLDAAKLAYSFGKNPDNALIDITINARRNRGKGEAYTYTYTEPENAVRVYLMHANLRLFMATNDATYLEGIDIPIGSPAGQWPYSQKDWSPWMFYSVIQAKGSISSVPVESYEQYFVDYADLLLTYMDNTPYPVTIAKKQNYWLAWGASDATNYNRTLLIAHEITGDNKYREAVIKNTDFMLGSNAMGMSWTTGIGYVYPIDIQHEVSEDDWWVDPVPGITLYGINGGPVYYNFRRDVWESPSPEGKVSFVSDPSHLSPPMWRRFMTHPGYNTGQNEFTIHETMASTILTMAMLMPEGWTPSKELKNRKPRRPELLFGNWYLP